MARTFDERGLFGSATQNLCCNYAAWEDGTYSCDLFLGTATEPDEGNDYGAVYLFTSGFIDQEEEEWD
mgnify:CR=1 FL=1